MGHDDEVAVPVAGAMLTANLAVPPHAGGVVLFAHGSGSSRRSPRNRTVASRLAQVGLATVLTDLLTAEEERADAVDGRLRFDVDLLGERLAAIIDWLTDRPATGRLPLGLFGASTGAAAALQAAAARPRQVRAVVSRGGRPDLAGGRLGAVRAPTLLIVGELDRQVLELNEDASSRLGGVSSLWIVPRASHLFEEPGALDEVASAAAEWFDRHLVGGHGATDGGLSRQDDTDP
ncbi:dienelactone hydrolase family protein [Actinocatenispora comari]|uniref:Hydrolase n=1 Tax=Actinocatenispora comari TaxID=2807577 RepID=A0A8J4EKH8_9ACTN|nr:dienelactone hydrolase family protein [Actinocatenispora comari]GIL27411.1 hydrolase [Actinocatenispora comari]